MTPSRPGAVRPVPERLHTVTPRLVVADGAAAMAFYAEALGPRRWVSDSPGRTAS